MTSASITSLDRIPRKRVDKFQQRRLELAEAALLTLAQLGYARTSLREIAQNSEFSHGVLHYYFTDKTDLILCCVQLYKSRCVTRYDAATAGAPTYDALATGFLDALCATLHDEAHLHRLWYDLRSQSLFEPSFRADVLKIDASLQAMIWRVITRLAALRETTIAAPPTLAYAVFDGLFQQALLKHLAGDAAAIPTLHEAGAHALHCLFATATTPAPSLAISPAIG
jgi:AcrR family transcriptional regulator